MGREEKKDQDEGRLTRRLALREDRIDQLGQIETRLRKGGLIGIAFAVGGNRFGERPRTVNDCLWPPTIGPDHAISSAMPEKEPNENRNADRRRVCVYYTRIPQWILFFLQSSPLDVSYSLYRLYSCIEKYREIIDESDASNISLHKEKNSSIEFSRILTLRRSSILFGNIFITLGSIN